MGRWRMDERAQSIGLVRFFASLIIGAPLAYFVVKVTTPILDMSKNKAAGTAAAQTPYWLADIGEYAVVIFLFVAFFGILVLALYQRRVAG